MPNQAQTEAEASFAAQAAEFVAALEAISVDEGTQYGRLNLLAQEINRHMYATHAVDVPFMNLAQAWKCFVLETVERCEPELAPKLEMLPKFYDLFAVRMRDLFRSLCAAELVARRGFPLPGYTILRNVFDSVVLVSAAAQGSTDLNKLMGIKEGTSDFRKERKMEEKTVRTAILKSLSDTTRQSLLALDLMFDDETHGQNLSVARTDGWFEGTKPLQFAPEYDDLSFSLFRHRYCEIAWMVHRMLPMFQLDRVLFGADWGQKWCLLDESFLKINTKFAAGLEVPIGPAMTELFAKHFAYDEKTVFWVPTEEPRNGRK